RLPPQRTRVPYTTLFRSSAARIIADLRRVGIRVSLDDFGTGQSSLGRLRDFPFDKLKIDRAFVSSVLDDRPSEHIIRAILAMCEDRKSTRLNSSHVKTSY